MAGEYDRLCVACGIAQELNTQVITKLLDHPENKEIHYFHCKSKLTEQWAVIRDLRISSEFLILKCYISRGKRTEEVYLGQIEARQDKSIAPV